ncbi:MAG: RNA polymerase sigma factor [Lentisphaeraceae bacterium]|nr:RNA polymerase sigma factor [Lentisphaeraceae bacterium]
MNKWNTRVTLLEKIRDQHDETSWEDFVYYYKQYIYVVVRSMNLNHHDAEEIVQIVLLKVWDKLPEFQYDSEKGRFRGWLCRVTGNIVKNFLRSRKSQINRVEKMQKQDEENYLNNVSLPEIEKISSREWENYIANMAWNNIEKDFTENVKECFLLMADDLPVATIAEKFGISESSVYVYKKRVQDRLFAEINRLENDLG